MEILVCDDDAHIREVVRFALEKAGWAVREAADGRAALEAFERGGVDLVILDVLMPEEDGLAVCRRIRSSSAVPILFLSSRDDEVDRVLGLELGGDDYVTKPFSPRELVARVRAIARRARESTARPPEDDLLRVGPLEIDRGRHRVRYAGQEVPLTATEMALLVALAARPGRVFRRDELVDRAWGHDHFITERTIDSHVRRIRKKLAEVGGDPLETVYGVGYRVREC
ncbi:MAG: response regulator transcription factor [Deltaproteobacteria bacterium]|nr:response regulator transcription factor [Deltaproteobacteria bacterium]MCB9785255.1 response regulator transcription factor [Deltaproteobacteria bacterium]